MARSQKTALYQGLLEAGPLLYPGADADGGREAAGWRLPFSRGVPDQADAAGDELLWGVYTGRVGSGERVFF